MENEAFLREFLKDSLYVIDTEPQSGENEKVKNGEGTAPTPEDTRSEAIELKSIVIIIKEKELSSEVSTFLTKILSAANLDDTHYSLFFTHDGKDLPFVMADTTAKFLIFGISPFELGLQHIQVNKYHLASAESSQYLWGDALDKIKDDANAKKALWLNMKKMFNI